eukprot:TRINITY_DN875_c0_g1_i2.p1 TRINITY_DN875_c0_g1~~TRINITY_DN875_c0_g1_i2.p1  ORF type:complete len:234 (-),score=11.03 TRINITY_DN875_c0_g1_i2:549-1250(-)
MPPDVAAEQRVASTRLRAVRRVYMPPEVSSAVREKEARSKMVRRSSLPPSVMSERRSAAAAAEDQRRACMNPRAAKEIRDHDAQRHNVIRADESPSARQRRVSSDAATRSRARAFVVQHAVLPPSTAFPPSGLRNLLTKWFADLPHLPRQPGQTPSNGYTGLPHEGRALDTLSAAAASRAWPAYPADLSAMLHMAIVRPYLRRINNMMATVRLQFRRGGGGPRPSVTSGAAAL